MYAKTCAIAFIAIWLFNASLAAPAPEPEPEAQPDPNGCRNGCGSGCGNGCGSGCAVTKVHTAVINSNIPIKTTHKILGNSDCGCGGLSNGCGWLSNGCGYGGWTGGWDCGSDWGNAWDSGCGGSWGDCVVTKIHHVPVVTHIPIKTTHRVIPQNDCGCNAGWSSLAGYGCGCGSGCGCNGWL